MPAHLILTDLMIDLYESVTLKVLFVEEVKQVENIKPLGLSQQLQ
jgi:hypothetical protein